MNYHLCVACTDGVDYPAECSMPNVQAEQLRQQIPLIFGRTLPTDPADYAKTLSYAPWSTPPEQCSMCGDGFGHQFFHYRTPDEKKLGEIEGEAFERYPNIEAWQEETGHELESESSTPEWYPVVVFDQIGSTNRYLLRTHQQLSYGQKIRLTGNLANLDAVAPEGFPEPLIEISNAAIAPLEGDPTTPTQP